MRFRGLTVLVLLGITLLFGIITHSQDDTSTPEPTITIRLTPGATTTAAIPEPSQLSSPITIMFDDVVHSDLQLMNLIATEEIWFAIPPNWSVDTLIDVQLLYTASELLNDNRTSMSIYVNGEPIISFKPVVSDGNRVDEVNFQIPPDLVIDGEGFLIEIHAYLSVTNEVCEITSSPAQWLVVHKESTVELTPDTNPSAPNMRYLSEHLYSTSLFLRQIPVPLLFVLPNSLSQDALTTAISLVQRLGYRDARDLEFLVRTVDSVSENELATSNVVVIGLPEEQPLMQPILENLEYEAFVDDHFVTPEGIIIPDSNAVFHLVISPWNPMNNAFLITATSEEGLQTAGLVFRNTEVYLNLNGSFKFARPGFGLEEPVVVSEVTAEATPEVTAEATPEVTAEATPEVTPEVTQEAFDPDLPWVNSTITLEEIGVGNAYSYGLGINSYFWNLRRPPGWQLREGSELTLNIGTSYLEPGSYVSVFLDNVFIGTIDTSEDWELEETFELDVEAINTQWQMQPGADAVLRVDVSNLWRLNICQQYDNQAIWTLVEGASQITMPHFYVELPNIRAFPYPFAHRDTPRATSIILSDNPSDFELALVFKLAAWIGRGAFGEANLELVKADELISLAPDNHVILISMNDENRMLIETRQILGILGLIPLYEGIPEDEGEAVGLIREAIAPWNADVVLMLISSTNEDSLEFIIDSLGLEGELPDDVRIMENTDSVRLLRR